MKVLLIGIGTTGLQILEELETLYYTSYKQARLPRNVQLVAIDTDRREPTATSGNGSQIRVVNISYDNIQGAIHNLQQQMQGRKPLWLQECERLAEAGLPRIALQTTAGAAHVRAAGRLSLWGKFAGPNGVKQAIQDALDAMVDPAAEPELHIYVVGSLVGGTGSSLIVDLGFLLRVLVPSNQVRGIWGIALIPVGDVDVTQTSGRGKLGNAFATLRELRFYFDLLGGGREEDDNWPDLTERRVLNVQPYDFIFLLGGAALGLKLETLRELIALRLLLGIIPNIGGRIPAESARGGRFAISDRFATFGLAGFYHPRREIAEAAACLLALAAIQRLLKEPNPEEIYQKTLSWWSRKIKEYVGELDRFNGSSVEARLDREVFEAPDFTQLLRDVEGRLNSGGTYYKVMDGNTNRVLSRLNEDLVDSIEKLVNDTKNLTAAKVALEKISDIIDAMYAHWENIGVPAPADPWDAVVVRQVANMTRVTTIGSKFAYLFEHRQVIKERFSELLKLLKLYLLRKHLRANMQGHARNFRLRVVELIDRAVTDRDDRRGESARTTLHERLTELYEKIGKNPYLSEIWYSDQPPRDVRGFEQDVKHTLAEITHNPEIRLIPGGLRSEQERETLIAELAKNEKLLSLEFSGENGENLWDYIQDAPSGRILAEKLKRVFIKEVLPRIPEVDMTQKITPVGFSNLAENTERGLVTLDPERGGVKSLVDRIQYLIGRDAAQLGRFFEPLRRITEHFEAKEDPDLRSYVLFLWEKGDINVQTQLADARQWERFYLDRDTRQTYLLHTFDVERRFRLRSLEERVRMLLHVFVQYDADRRPLESPLRSMLSIDEKKQVVFAYTDEDGIRNTFRIMNPFDDDSIWSFAKYLDETPQALRALMEAARATRGQPPWRELANSFDTWGPACFGERVAEVRNKYFGRDNRSGLLATI